MRPGPSRRRRNNWQEVGEPAHPAISGGQQSKSLYHPLTISSHVCAHESDCAVLTTSLPQTMGGTCNEDYCHTWLRDSAFTLDSLLKLDFTQEAEAFIGGIDG